jgi:hypothetical protein
VFEEEGAERGNVAARDGVVDGGSHCDTRMLLNSFGYATKVIHYMYRRPTGASKAIFSMRLMGSMK